MDALMLKLTRGKWTFSQLAGWTIVLLTATGAKTGLPRTLPLIGILDREKIALIASSFGRKRNPAWYYNLKKNPECVVTLNGKTGKYVARETNGEEYQRYWQMAVLIYVGYEKYKQRAAPRHIPVMVLEPKQ